MRKSTTEQRQEYVARQRGHDPKISSRTYNVDLIRYQNYHNANTDMKQIRKWALDYAKKYNSSKYNLLNKAGDFELRTIGIIGRAISLEYPIIEEHISRVQNDIDSLITKYSITQQSKEVKVVVAKPVEDKASPHIAEVNAAIDDYVINNKEFSMKGYIATANIPGPMARVIGQSFVRLEKELKEAVGGKDEQLKEAYAHLGKVKLKRFHAMIQQIIVDCAQQVITAKVRKPRVRKEKPPSVLASKMKYLKQFDEMKLVSEKPEKIVGADTVWLYDTDKRKMTVYVADNGQSLSIKGTTITGFSAKDSGVKIIRKPELILTGNLAKRTLMTSFKTLKTKASVPNGRTSDKMIILKVF